MIPKVKRWRVTCDGIAEWFIVNTPTKALAVICVRMDYPRTWGHSLRVGLLRKAVK
jgi:hypothetical protein